MRKKLLTIVMSIAIAVCMIPAMAFAEDATVPYMYVYVDGNLVTSDNCSDVLGDGKVSFDYATGTLTLNGVTLGDDTDAVIRYLQMAENEPLTIKLIGENTFSSNVQNGITIEGNNDMDTSLTITGDGSLTITGSADRFNQRGILACNLTNNSNITLNNFGNGYGIELTGSFINTGSVKSDKCKYGVSAENGDFQQKSGTITITNSIESAITVNSYTQEAGTVTAEGFNGMGLCAPVFVLNGGTLNLKSSAGSTYVIGMQNIPMRGDGNGEFEVNGGALNIDLSSNAMVCEGLVSSDLSPMITGGKINVSASNGQMGVMGLVLYGQPEITGGEITVRINPCEPKPSEGYNMILAGVMILPEEDTSDPTFVGFEKAGNLVFKASNNFDGSSPVTYDPSKVVDGYKYLNIKKYVAPKTIALKSISFSKASFTYSGKAQGPTITVTDANGKKLVKGTDYKISGTTTATKVGTYKVTVTGIGNYTGTLTKSYTIAAAPLDSVAFSKTKFTYSGESQGPTVTVKNAAGAVLTAGTDYTVSGAKATKTGAHKVTITGKGNYAGTLTKTFKIVPKKPGSVTVNLSGAYNKMKIKWSKSVGATGYFVYYKKASADKWNSKIIKSADTVSTTVAKLAGGAKYQVKVIPYVTIGETKTKGGTSTVETAYTLKKLAAPKISKKGKGKVLVKWVNINGETGYQISRSTSKTKTNIVATCKTTSGKTKVVKAKSGKKYYYKVRAYKVVNGKRINAPWSKVKAYTVK